MQLILVVMELLWLRIIVLYSVVMVTEASGITSHIEVGERTKQFLALNSEGVNYTELILKHPDAYQAGCPYPDAYYPSLCFDGDYHNISEQTHWTPFLNATVNYIRSQYSRPWSERAEKLVVFLLAVVQHQVADVNWHSLGIEQGFLETMGKVNYHGSFSAAHSDGDFGGDVLNLYGLDMSYIPLVDTWYVPVDDLVNIYTELYGNNGTMVPEVVVECTNWLFLGRLGENIGVVEYLYPVYADASPFMLDHLQDYYLGGIDDMAVWSANVYRHTVTMLDHGTEVCHIPRNPIYIQCNVIDESARLMRSKRSVAPAHFEAIKRNSDWLYAVIGLVEKEDYVIKQVDGGITFSSTEHYKDRVQKMIAHRQSETSTRASRNNFTTPEIFYKTHFNYSRLGESLLTGDISSDGNPDLVIAATGYGTPGNHQRGAVYVILGSESGLPEKNLTVEIEADLIIEGPQLNGRFGASLAIVDVNIDGYEDLVVGAPSVGSDTLNYHGEVYVYLGSVLGISSTPDITITCSERYCNLGWTLTSGDVNGDGYDDLLLGAPFAPSGGEQRGFVGVLLARDSLIDGTLTELDLDYLSRGRQDYAWFGYSVAHVAGSSNGEAQILVGSPTYRLCHTYDCQNFTEKDIQAVGMVTSLTLTGLSEQLEGNVTFGQMGYSLHSKVTTDQQLYGVSATALENSFEQEFNSSKPVLQVGQVSVYDSADLSKQPFFTIRGDREFDRAGANIQFVDINGDSQDDVILSSPLRSEEVDIGREEGRVYVFIVDEAMRGQTYSVTEADIAIGLGEEKARFGQSLAAITSNNGQIQLVASAPNSNHGGRLSGLITVQRL